MLNRFLRTDIGEIRIFSRDEKKQDDMRHEYQSKYPDVAHKIKFFIGDVRSLDSVRMVMPGVDYIFHAAALKQVPSCEFFPMEAVRTNVFGTDNVLSAAIEETVAVAKSRIQNGDVFVQKAPACTIQTQVEAVCELFGGDKKKIKVIGVRHGEKLY